MRLADDVPADDKRRRLNTPLAAQEGIGLERNRAWLGREVEVLPGESLLDAAERAGAGISSFCRAGICGTCRTRLISGEVSCEGEALTDRDRQDGYVLPCVSVVAGDCVLEA
jgi:ferredoxin